MNIFFNALLYYSRIRVPKSVVCNEHTLNEAYRYLPLVGIIVGTFASVVAYVMNLFVSDVVAILAAMGTMILLTGGLHEDGIADFADGFGAGHDKDAILRIMKDSHIGTYGVLALIMALMSRYLLLDGIGNNITPALIVAQGASKVSALTIIYTSNYVLRNGAKSQHSVLGLSTKNLIIGAAIGLLPIFFFGWQTFVAYVTAAALLCFLFRRYIMKWIGGYTGDTLGAVILLSELLFYVMVKRFS